MWFALWAWWAAGAEPLVAETLVQESDLWIPSPAGPLSRKQVKACAAGDLPRGMARSVVVITPSSIEYAGERVGLLADGRIPAADLNGPMSAGMYERASAVREHMRAAEEKGCAIPAGSERGGRVLIAVDGSVPFATVLSVVYALGQAGFADMLYRVDAPVTTVEGSAMPTGASESVMLDARGYQLGSARGTWLGCEEGCATGPDTDALRAALGKTGAQQGVLMAHPETPWSSVRDSLLAMSSRGDGTPLLRQTVLLGAFGQPSPETTPSWTGEPGLPVPVLPAEGAPAVWGPLPAIEPPKAKPPVEEPPAEAAAVPASVEGPVILGDLAREALESTVMSHIDEIAECYRGRLAESPELEGQVVVKWSIKSDGSTSGVKLNVNELDELAGQCLVDVFDRMTFPPPGGGFAIVSYPLMFEL